MSPPPAKGGWVGGEAVAPIVLLRELTATKPHCGFRSEPGDHYHGTNDDDERWRGPHGPRAGRETQAGDRRGAADAPHAGPPDKSREAKYTFRDRAGFANDVDAQPQQ